MKSVSEVQPGKPEEPPIRKMPAYTKGRRNQHIGQLKVGTEQVMLEIRDEQVEDGDTISLEVNGAVIAEGMEVSQQGRWFGVSLKRGRNRIIFRAENLGRIPPNTAVLLIHADGERRKFHLSTDFERNNVLDVFFELRD